jgi:RNA polymerase sigma factor (sigma-70 family)
MKSGDSVETARGIFPSTHLSIIDGLGSPSPERRVQTLGLVAAAYWKPVYKYVRFKYHRSPEEAQDLTQGFFARVLEREFLNAYDPQKAKFRTYLRVCLDRHVGNEVRSQRRIKRGGGLEFLSLDFAGAEAEMSAAHRAPSTTPEEYFEKEWIRSVFAGAVGNLHARADSEGKALQFRIFEEYDLEPDAAAGKVTYERLAGLHGLSVTDVTNYLAEMRRQFRQEVLDVLRGLTANEVEFRLEARSILGIEIK